MSSAAPDTRSVLEPGSHELTTSAVIDAPPSAVWRAHVEQDLFVTGGSWRIVHVDPDGDEYAFRGVYHSVVPESQIVLTFDFEGMPGHVCLETHSSSPVDGGRRTEVTQHAVFRSVADRDGMAQSGMEAHAPVAMAQLQAVAQR